MSDNEAPKAVVGATDAVEITLSHGQSAAYGLIQGLTEFLPVSSSGHLKIAHLLGLGSLGEHELPFDVLLHAATLIAIVIAFRKEVLLLFRLQTALPWVVLLAAIPAGIVGLVAGDYIEAAGEHWWILAAMYVVTAALLTVSERISLKRGIAPMTDEEVVDKVSSVTWRQALLVGFVQIAALFPGVSRSGSTVSAGLLAGLQPRLAVAFSFLVGLPLLGGATAKKALDGGFGDLVAATGWAPLCTGFIVSLVSGVAAIAALKFVASAGKLRWFAAYCGLVAVACVFFALMGVGQG